MIYVLLKPQKFLTTFNDKYELCCHGNVCVFAPPIPFKTWLAYKSPKKEYVDLSVLFVNKNKKWVPLRAIKTFIRKKMGHTT